MPIYTYLRLSLQIVFEVGRFSLATIASKFSSFPSSLEKMLFLYQLGPHLASLF